MRALTTLILAIFASAYVSHATIAGFQYSATSSKGYTVPSGKVLVLQSVSFTLATTAANSYVKISDVGNIYLSNSNSICTLKKPIYVNEGATVFGGATGTTILIGVLIDASDMYLFVGGGSTLGTITIAGNNLTGVLQLPYKAAGTKVLFQSSTNLIDWSFDNSVMVQRTPDITKLHFTVPVSGENRYYRALVRRNC